MSASQKNPPLRELQFGELDASLEANVSPELLRDGYVDFRSAAYAIATRNAWVLLGPKGAGKSTVLEHLRLIWQDREDRFMTYWELDAFPVNDVTCIDMGLRDGTARVRAAWEFLLLLRTFESVARDHGRSHDREFEMVHKALCEQGYLGADFGTVVMELSRVSGAVDMKIFSAGSELAANRAALPEMPTVLREALATVGLEHHHLIALDGLDSFFFEGGAGWESLSGLVDALAATNRFFLEAGLPISIVATLRSDHFDALNSQNSNKLKRQIVYLDWTAGGIGAGNQLWAMVSKKASVRQPGVQDVVKQYLSLPMDRPSFPSVAEYLLSYTRLLPRDIVAMMHYLREVHPGSTEVNEDQAKEAAARYSEEYFVGEVMNNLSGVLAGDKAHRIPAFRDALRAAPTRYFSLQYLEEELVGELTRPELVALLRRLFETGGVGISNPNAASGKRYTDFVFRRVSGAAFTPRYEFLLHDALTRAWNRPWH